MKAKIPFLAGLCAFFTFTTLASSQSPAFPPPASRRDELRQAAWRQLRASDADGAMKTWRELALQFPTDASLREEAGDSMADVGRYADATIFYESQRDLPGAKPAQQALAITKLAQLAELQYQTDNARALYQTALPLIPSDSPLAHEIHLRIEDSFRRIEDVSGLAASWQSYLSTHGQDVDVALHLGAALTELHRPAEAVAWLQKAIAWAPTR